ncbi:phage protein NinX family protein [Paraburkholderia tropica]|uniref:phage protein NinX family protein n=1 Tax=Paraburkholderia tropica TaxID=92647 RepID=UPI003D26A903
MKVANLEGALLDYWVAKADGCLEVVYLYQDDNYYATDCGVPVYYSRDWSKGGPIIEREGLAIAPRAHPDFIATMTWASQPYSGKSAQHIGSTPLIAAMRAFVASKFGEDVEDAPSVTG